MALSVCVIGAGIGGLTAGAYLAKYGYKVTVLEKAATVGGSAGFYVRKGRVFPTGATIAFGLEQNGLLRNMLDELDINVPAVELSHPMDVILPDRQISIFKDPIRWEEELRRKFPDRSKDILRFWYELTRISQNVHALVDTRLSLPIRRYYDLGDLPKYAVTHSLSLLYLVRYSRWTVEDLMRKYRVEKVVPLRQFLNAQLIDAVQTNVSQAALLPSSLALTIYRKGSFCFENGIAQMSQSLADRIKELGGDILLSSPVRTIRRNNMKNEWDVDSLKCTSSFSIVINNTGISFGAGTSHIENQDLSWGAFRVDAIVKDEVLQGKLKDIKLPFAYQIVPDSTRSKFLKDEKGPLYVTFQRSIDQNGLPAAGEIVMTASIHTNPKDWFSCSKKDYKWKKEQLINEILSEIEKLLPVKGHLLHIDAGTPLTYKKFIGKAEVGGYPLTIENAIVKQRSIRTSAPKMYIVGEQAFPGPGTLSSAMSGYFAARAILKEHPNQ